MPWDSVWDQRNLNKRLYTFSVIDYNVDSNIKSGQPKRGEVMPSDKEMINNLIDIYANLQRIKNAEDAEKELDYQLTLVRAKLESFGIVTSDLDIK